MKQYLGFCVAAALASTSAAAAPKPADAPVFVAPADRVVAGGRAALVVIPQTHIETRIDTGRVAADVGGGGLVGGIIIAVRDDKKKLMAQSLREKADATVAPLRQALAGFDVDTLARDVTSVALAKPDWFQLKSIAISRDASLSGRAAFIGASTTPQVAFVAYRYDLSPDFSNIRVTAELSLVAKGGSAASEIILSRQTITSIVQLRAPSYEPYENVARWSADGGKLAKAALNTAFKALEQLVPQALNLSQADMRTFTAKNREKAFAAGLYGPLIERGKDGSGSVLIWSGGLTTVQPTP